MIFVIVIPKEGLAGTKLAKPFCNKVDYDYFFGRYHIKGRLGWAVANQTVFWYDSDKDL